MKNRKLWLHILLLIVTFGIYAIVWTCALSKEMKRNKIGMCLDGWRHVLCWLLTFNFYNILFVYDAGRYMTTFGVRNKCWLYFGLKFIPFIGTIVVLTMLQKDINNYYNLSSDNTNA